MKGAAVRSGGISWALAGFAGALFGAGLLIGSLTVPARVVGFLDVTGSWDPSLGIALAAAVSVYAIAFRRIYGRRSRPLLDQTFHVPTRRDIDRPLIVGAALFGVGWGLAGICPGPAVVGLFSGNLTALVFVAAMLAGMRMQYRWAAR